MYYFDSAIPMNGDLICRPIDVVKVSVSHSSACDGRRASVAFVPLLIGDFREVRIQIIPILTTLTYTPKVHNAAGADFVGTACFTAGLCQFEWAIFNLLIYLIIQWIKVALVRQACYFGVSDALAPFLYFP